MNSNDVLKYIIELLNINTSDNSLVVEDVIEELASIDDLLFFRKFVKENLRNEKYKFLNGFQKFNAMAQDFKRNSANNNEDKIITYCKKLVDKCRRISCIAYDSKPKGFNFYEFTQIATYSNFKENNKTIFNEKEIKLLNMVGGCKRWLNDYDCNSFLEDLVKSVHKLRKNNAKQITSNADNSVIKRLNKHT